MAVLALTPGGQAFIAPIAGSLNAATAGLIGIKAATGAVIGAIAGGLSPALAGGDRSDILKVALVGGIRGGITSGVLHAWEPQVAGFNLETARHVAGHGVVGGSANYAMGGKFQDGFLSAAVSAAASNAGLLGRAGGGSLDAVRRTVTAGVIGGTVAEIGGGKFANGAYTAAFQHLLNAEFPEAMGKIGIGIEWKGAEFSDGVHDLGTGSGHVFAFARNSNGDIISMFSHGPDQNLPNWQSVFGVKGTPRYAIISDSVYFKEWTVTNQVLEKFISLSGTAVANYKNGTYPKFTPTNNCANLACSLVNRTVGPDTITGGQGPVRAPGIGKSVVFPKAYSPYHLMKSLDPMSKMPSIDFRKFQLR